MSFILDALKKSEAERRQGEVPRLQNEIGAPAPRRRAIWPFLLIFALLLNGAVIGGWLLLRREEPPVAATPPAVSAPVLASRGAAPVGSENLASRPAPPVEETQPPAGSPAPPTEPTVHPAAPPRAVLPSAKKAASGTKAPAVAVLETPASPPESHASFEDATEQPAQPVKSRLPAKPVAVASHQPEQAPSPAADPVRTTIAAPAPAESFPPLSELPAGVRAGLPELNLQLHFFSPEPGRRLVRLNGLNLREGDRGGDDLSVVEIMPDGIRLSRRGVRFFLATDRR